MSACTDTLKLFCRGSSYHRGVEARRESCRDWYLPVMQIHCRHGSHGNKDGECFSHLGLFQGPEQGTPAHICPHALLLPFQRLPLQAKTFFTSGPWPGQAPGPRTPFPHQICLMSNSLSRLSSQVTTASMKNFLISAPTPSWSGHAHLSTVTIPVHCDSMSALASLGACLFFLECKPQGHRNQVLFIFVASIPPSYVPGTD